MYYIVISPRFFTSRGWLSRIANDGFATFSDLRFAQSYSTREAALADVEKGLRSDRPWAKGAKVMRIHPLNVAYSEIER